MSQKIKDKAQKYYPSQWTEAHLIALIEKGALTEEEYREVTGHDYQRAD